MRTSTKKQPLLMRVVATLLLMLLTMTAQTAWAQETSTVIVNVTGNGTVTYNDKSATNGEVFGVAADKGTDVTLTLAAESGYAASVEYGYTNSSETTMSGAKLPINGTTATLTVPNDLKDGTYVNLTVTFVSALAGGADEASAVALADNTVTDFAGGWYKVESDITFDHTLNLLGDTHLTIADGKTMTVNNASGEGIHSDFTLTVSGAGALNVTTTATYGLAVCVGNYVQTGSTVMANGYCGISCTDDFTFDFDNDFTFNGGQLTATGNNGGGIWADNNITLSCTSATDFIQASSYDGGTVKVADGKVLTDGTNFYSGTLTDDEKSAIAGKTLIPKPDPADFADNGDGTYTIYSALGWDYFCYLLEAGKKFNDNTVKLGDNITVTRMAGGAGHEFCGTFDGDHHTLTVQYGSPAAPIEQQQFVAPFVETARNTSPVFRNLTIDGNIYVKYADSSVEPGVGGLIGHLFGNVTVEHCTSNVVINSDKDRVGGFVGLCEYAVTFTDCKSSAVVSSSIGNISGFVGWSRASSWTIAFEGCLFNGKLLQLNGTGGSGGCFVGWKGDAKTVNINNCLVALDDVESMASSNSATFCRQHNDKLPAEIKNSYYTTAFGATQGTQVHSIVAGDGVSVAMAGNVINKYETSGITFYGTGIMCDGKVYAVKNDEVSLTLSYEDQEGYAFTGYEAKDSLQNTYALNADDDNYTQTMPDDDVTISATWKMASVKGDVNGDGKVDISDVVALVNAILNDSPYNDAYDVNSDTSVGINDVVVLVNIILGQ